MKPKTYWSLQLTTGFKKNFKKLSEVDQWRVRGFIRSVIHIKKPTAFYNTTECVDCPPSVVLFGLSDDGMGHKVIEVQVWINVKIKTLHFLKCKKAEKS